MPFFLHAGSTGGGTTILHCAFSRFYSIQSQQLAGAEGNLVPACACVCHGSPFVPFSSILPLSLLLPLFCCCLCSLGLFSLLFRCSHARLLARPCPCCPRPSFHQPVNNRTIERVNKGTMGAKNKGLSLLSLSFHVEVKNRQDHSSNRASLHGHRDPSITTQKTEC